VNSIEDAKCLGYSPKIGVVKNVDQVRKSVRKNVINYGSLWNRWVQEML
jgi:hypothetical protein